MLLKDLENKESLQVIDRQGHLYFLIVFYIVLVIPLKAQNYFYQATFDHLA